MWGMNPIHMLYSSQTQSKRNEILSEAPANPDPACPAPRNLQQTSPGLLWQRTVGSTPFSHLGGAMRSVRDMLTSWMNISNLGNIAQKRTFENKRVALF